MGVNRVPTNQSPSLRAGKRTPALARACSDTRGAADASANHIQRVSAERCADCGSEVVRRLGARGPLPTRCNLCATRRQPRIQLRAYLRSSQRLALRLGLSVVEGLARQAIDDLDQSKAPRS